MRKAAWVLGLLAALSVHAGSPELVFDVFNGERPESSRPTRFFSTGRVAYFFANDGSGAELWITDGTAPGTYRLAELTPGADDEYPDDDSGGFTRSGDLVWFWHADPFRDHQVALWRTDGTRTGTFRVARDVAYYSAELVPVGTRGIIARTSEGFVVSDGTPRGTLRFGDAPPFVLGGGFGTSSMVLFRGFVYFVQGSELWRTDGTVQGTRHVADFPESLDDVLQVVAADDAMYVVGDSESDSETFLIYRTTGETPELVATLEKRTRDDAPRLIVNNGVAYAIAGIDEQLTELYRLGSSTQRVTVVEGRTEPFTRIQSSGGAIWFETEQPYVLWRSDGTAAGTRVFEGVATDAQLVIDRTRVFMLQHDGVFVSDGKTATRLTTMSPDTGDEPAVIVGDRLVMAVYDEPHGGELWTSDGTANSTRLLKNIRADGGSDPTFLRRAGEELIFGARSNAEGIEPWITDGTLFNTRLLADIDRGASSSDPHAVTTLANGKTVFDAGQRLYATNGNLTELLRVTSDEIYMGWQSPRRPLPVIGGRAWVVYSGDEDEVWSTDGTRAGTTMLLTLPRSRGEGVYAATSRYLFYVADDALWRTDGTEGGTFALASEPEQIHAVGDQVFFITWTSAFGRELWVTNGTLAGTHVVKDIWRGKEDAFLNRWWEERVNPMHSAGGRLFFAADDGVHGFEPWVSDGTEEGTYLLRDIAPGEEDSMLAMFDEEVAAFAGGSVYFAADDGVHGRELWRSDLRTAELVRDICPGPCASSPEHLRPIGDAVYLAADDGVHGSELWLANAETARFVADVNAGPDSSHPREMTELDDSIYFFATTDRYGQELWRVRTPTPRRRSAR
jgi:ELWxxDGT repeat protein